jgi:hypothetical protein
MSNRWTENQLIVAFALYCQMPFGKIHHRNPKIIQVSEKISRTPSALSMKMANFASLDPVILQSGRSGLGNASKKDRIVWNKFHENWELAFEKAYSILGRDLEDNFSIDSDPIDYSSPDITIESKTRKGQKIFRNSILSSYKSACCISGLNYDRMLIASHIKPWNKDIKNRMNPRNGLCLSVLYDKAFDLGLITISTSFKVKVSNLLIEKATDSFSKNNLHSIDGQEILLPEKFYPDKEFLSYHNENIFKT